MSVTVGIDPGKDGFICAIDSKGFLGAWPTPTLKISTKGNKRGYDVAAMRRILVNASPDIVVIEKQQSMPGMLVKGKRVKQGVASSFSTGQGFGLWEGLVVGLGIKYMIVHPRTWQNVCIKDIPGDNTKARSIIAAGRNFPSVDLRKSDRCRIYHDGKADALNIAWYGRWLTFDSGEEPF